MNIVNISQLFLLSFLISFLLAGGSWILCFKEWNSEKLTAYECGFAPIRYPSEPFTIRFFLVGIIFLIFDLEILYVLPYAYHAPINYTGKMGGFSFIIFIVVGLVYEWKKGGLEWI